MARRPANATGSGLERLRTFRKLRGIPLRSDGRFLDGGRRTSRRRAVRERVKRTVFPSVRSGKRVVDTANSRTVATLAPLIAKHMFDGALVLTSPPGPEISLRSGSCVATRFPSTIVIRESWRCPSSRSGNTSIGSNHNTVDGQYFRPSLRSCACAYGLIALIFLLLLRQS